MFAKFASSKTKFPHPRSIMKSRTSSKVTEKLVRWADLELVQDFINGLRASNFILYGVGFFRRSCWLRLQNPPCLKQNFLALAPS